MNRKIDVDVSDFTISRRGQTKEIIRRFLRNKAAVIGFIIIVILTFCALFPGFVSSDDFTTLNIPNRFQAPSAEHILGTDELGRDMLTRIVWASRTSLSIGTLSVLLATVLGVSIGSISGFYSGIIDNIFMRIVDIIMAIPNLLLGISVVAALGSTQMNLVLAIGLGLFPTFARVTRSAVIVVRDQEFIEAARATGANDFRLIWKYVLPNSLAPIIVQVSMSTGS
jgi:peptide/nickel transport system permease protein